MSDREPLLEIRNLDAGYDNATIVRDISFSVDPGEVVGILGPNGAGKSTVMKTIVGLTTRHKGSIVFRGEDITTLPTHERSKRGIGYLPQQDAIFPQFTVSENLQLAGHAGGSKARDRERIFEQFPQLRDLQSRQAMLLSGGERKMLALGCAAITDPDLYLLDEPSDGLAPNLAADVFERIERLATEGKAVVINEQKEQVLDHLDRALILRGGVISDEGDAQRLLEEETLKETYLSQDPGR